jgi:cobalt-precorrin 5A hydrolase / precorrin-3B C17-methyltransferase
MNSENRLVVFYITNKGFEVAKKIAGFYPDAEVLKFETAAVSRVWRNSGRLVFVMAAGIVVRSIAALLQDKKTDPAVVVIDEKGSHIVSLLSGHLGGANKLAREISRYIGGEPVITTSSDVNDLPSVDLWAEENGLIIDNPDVLPSVGTRLINNSSLHIYSEIEMAFPGSYIRDLKPDNADILITNRKKPEALSDRERERLLLRPRNLVLGIGCNSGTSAQEIENVVRKSLDDRNLAFSSIHSIATIDKKADEKGLVEFSKKYSLPIKTFTPDELNLVKGVSSSEAAFRATGARAVAEPAALLAGEADSLLLPKQKNGNVTLAVAEREDRNAIYVTCNEFKKEKTRAIESNDAFRISHHALRSGKIFVVGTGPGNAAHITPYARKAILESDVIVGYGTYLELIQELIRGKEVLSTGMTQEIDRCRKAIELALTGRTVAVISGGDPGIYAMAGLVFELLRSRDPLSVIRNEIKDFTPSPITPDASRITVEIVPGISALNACASRLGAPLMHDFASISLSDRLTPWELIEGRLEAAAMADFVIAIYNPRSKGRVEQIEKARDIILKYRNSDTPVGIVKGAMRENEKIIMTDLGNMTDHEIDMQTTVIIGNSNTYKWEGWMITPRGYERKKQF